MTTRIWFRRPTPTPSPPQVRLALTQLEARDVPALYTVVNTNDGGPGSLRDAIETINRSYFFFNLEPNVINFGIPGDGVHTINVQSPLPQLFSGVTLDAGTQPGYSGTPKVVLDGAAAGPATSGLMFNSFSQATVVRGLSVVRFSQYGLDVRSGNTTIVGCYLGVRPDGTAAGNGFGGVQVYATPFFFSPTNTARVVIGGPNKAVDANVISGNGFHGVVLYGETFDTTVQNNFIGTDPTGTGAVPNGTAGVHLEAGTSGNTVADNLISGNTWGVELYGEGTANNVVAGNLIGTDVAGAAAVPNKYGGVFVADGASRNTIGGAAANVLSGNGFHGVVVSGAAENTIDRNLIGTDRTGLLAVPNASSGVLLQQAATGNVVSGNVVSGNGLDGVRIAESGTTRNTLSGNYIGLGSAGGALPNTRHGVYVIDAADGNTVGGVTLAAANYIGGNGGFGVVLGATGNVVRNNFIGVDPVGHAPRPNVVGVLAIGDRNHISGNVIAHNTQPGIAVSGSGNTLSQNSVHDNGGLGIDLGTPGVTANDAGDQDTGANGLQNFPTISSASLGNGTVLLFGLLNSTPNAEFRIEFFASASADPSGYGEGQSFLGGTTETTDAAGNAAFQVTLPFAGGPGTVLTATATAVATGDTSEFSPALDAAPAPV